MNTHGFNIERPVQALALSHLLFDLYQRSVTDTIHIEQRVTSRTLFVAQGSATWTITPDGTIVHI